MLVLCVRVECGALRVLYVLYLALPYIFQIRSTDTVLYGAAVLA